MIPRPLSTDFLSERENGGDGHLEVLQTPGNSHDGDAEDQAEDQMDECDLPPAQEDPDKIHHNGKTARLAGTVDQFMAEGPQGIGAQLEQLHAERDADDGNAHQQANKVIDYGDQQSAENKPEKITE